MLVKLCPPVVLLSSNTYFAKLSVKGGGGVILIFVFFPHTYCSLPIHHVIAVTCCVKLNIHATSSFTLYNFRHKLCWISFCRNLVPLFYVIVASLDFCVMWSHDTKIHHGRHRIQYVVLLYNMLYLISYTFN